MKQEILYVFGGEKAQGAEIVIERLMDYNSETTISHLFIAPGNFASSLIEDRKPYKITVLDNLRKLNRSGGKAATFVWRALKNYFAVSFAVYRYLKSNPIEVIHANGNVPASYLLPLIIYSKLFLRSKIWVWSEHDLVYYSRMDALLSKLCARNYDGTFVVSKAVQAKYKGNPKVKVLYNGLDTEKFKPNSTDRVAFRASYQLPEGAIVLGMPAVVHPRKGQLGLIAALDGLSNQYPKLFLLLSGGFEAATPDYTKKVLESIAANDRVRHIGYVKNMIAFYNACDIIVNNSNISDSEPLGTTVYEAMACEDIVVASATGGTPEIIDDGVNGMLFIPDDTNDLEIKLKKAMETLPNATALKKAAREKVMEQFNITVMARIYNELLNDLKAENI